MVAYEAIRLAGHIMKHVVGVLLLAWRRVLRALAVAAVAAFVLAEIVGGLIAHAFPPLPTHVFAGVFAVIVAYCAALTTVIDELIEGALEAVRLVEGDAKAAARSSAILAEREVGEVGRGIRRMFGLERDPSAAPSSVRLAATALAATAALAARRTLTAPPARNTDTGASASASRLLSSRRPVAVATADAPVRSTPQPGGQTANASMPGNTLPPAARSGPVSRSRLTDEERRETLANIAATEAFVNSLPRQRVPSRPVPAARLPRIEWTYDRPFYSDMALTSPRMPAAASEPLRRSRSADAASAEAPAGPREQVAPPALPEMPPLPLKSPPPAAPARELLADATDPQRTSEPVAARPAPQPSAPTRTIPVTTPAMDDPGATHASMPTPVRHAEPDLTPAEELPGRAAPTPSQPRPASPSRPLADSGIWSRISQALVGNTQPLTERLDESGEP
ncbi:MAG TPA: hypothetical protein VF739_17075 [Ktedonobacterales bacterium]